MKKKNQTFKYIYIILILMIIDDHVASRIGFLTSIFPYDSFFMPMFIFASGYFYKKRKTKECIKHKVKKLLIPYLIWNVICIFLSLLIDKFFGLHWTYHYSLLNQFAFMLTYGPLNNINGVSWFVITLFWISIIYNYIYYYVEKTNQEFDKKATILFMIGGFICVYICSNHWGIDKMENIFWLRNIFYLQFYHYGHMFRKYFEKKLLKINKGLICCICIVVNMICILLFGNNITFISTSNMGSFTYWYLPLITSISGILFYYEIADFLAKHTKNNKIIDFIARNTFTIMEIHILFVNIPNFYIYHQLMNGSQKYLNFDVTTFQGSSWVRYNDTSNLIGFLCGIIGSLLVAYIIECFKVIYGKEEVK